MRMRMPDLHLPTTSQRVPAHTAAWKNQQIREEMEDRVHYYADHPDEIDDRLCELDHEWDIERLLEANAAVVALAGLSLGAFVDRRLLVLPAMVMGFLFMHALQGWCPPVPLFRRLGVRTQDEIEQERYALKALRGDFERGLLEGPGRDTRDAQAALISVRR